MSKVLCYDKPSGHFFRYDEAELHKRISKLNKQLWDVGHLSLNEVYDIINRDLPEDKQIRPSLYGWGDKFGYAERVDDQSFKIDIARCLVGPHSETCLIIKCLPIETKETES